MTFQPPVGGGFLNLTQITTALQNIVTAINGLTQSKSGNVATSSASWNPGSISTSSQAALSVSCIGANLGMNAKAAFSNSVGNLLLTAAVTTTNSVNVVLANLSGSTISTTAGTVTVWASSK